MMTRKMTRTLQTAIIILAIIIHTSPAIGIDPNPTPTRWIQSRLHPSRLLAFDEEGKMAAWFMIIKDDDDFKTCTLAVERNVSTPAIHKSKSMAYYESTESRAGTEWVRRWVLINSEDESILIKLHVRQGWKMTAPDKTERTTIPKEAREFLSTGKHPQDEEKRMEK